MPNCPMPNYQWPITKATFFDLAICGYIVYGLTRMLMSKNVNNDITMNPPIECFHSRGQHLCKFIEIKESVCIRKEFNSHRSGLGHQHGRRFIVLGHQYGRRDVMWKHSIAVLCGYSHAAKYWPQVLQAHEWQSLRKRNIIRVCMGILSDRVI